MLSVARSALDVTVMFVFFRIPATIWHRDIHDLELSQQRRDRFIAAISKEDLNVNTLEKYRICSRHFVLGKPASLYDCTNPDWFATANLEKFTYY